MIHLRRETHRHILLRQGCFFLWYVKTNQSVYADVVFLAKAVLPRAQLSFYTCRGGACSRFNGGNLFNHLALKSGGLM